MLHIVFSNIFKTTTLHTLGSFGHTIFFGSFVYNTPNVKSLQKLFGYYIVGESLGDSLYVGEWPYKIGSLAIPACSPTISLNLATICWSRSFFQL